MKEKLERAWQGEIFFPCHIVLWSHAKRGRLFAEGVWYSKGRKSEYGESGSLRSKRLWASKAYRTRNGGGR